MRPTSPTTGFPNRRVFGRSSREFLKTGTLPGNDTAFGPMAETIHDSLRYLTDGDLHAIATYLKDGPLPASQTVAKASASPQELADGKELYEDNCASCHQTNGQGMPDQVPALAGNTAVTAAQPNDLIMAILQGFGPHGTWGGMGAFGRQLTDEQIADIANYVRTAWNNHAEPTRWHGRSEIGEPWLTCPRQPGSRT